MPQSPIKPATINTLINLLTRISIQVNRAESNKYHRNRLKEGFDKGISALYSAKSILNNGKGFDEPTPEYIDRYYPHQGGWHDAITEEIAQFNCNGSAYITRVSECIIKTYGLINIHQGSSNRSLALFRGQHNAEWGIISSVGLKIPPDKVPDDKLSVSEYEVSLLRTWQELVMSTADLLVEIFGSQNAYGLDDPRWWSIKQHYEGETRLIDWTSSPLCALYFACIDWDGTIDTNLDGGVYAMMKRQGRRFVSKDVYNSLPYYDKDWHDCAGSTVTDYFNLNDHPGVLRSNIDEPDSDRQLSQDGHYMFNPRFNEYIQSDDWSGQTPFFFVIPKECKIPILRELYSIGYTPKKIVRGYKGKIAHQRLIQQLGIQE